MREGQTVEALAQGEARRRSAVWPPPQRPSPGCPPGSLPSSLWCPLRLWLDDDVLLQEGLAAQRPRGRTQKGGRGQGARARTSDVALLSHQGRLLQSRCGFPRTK